VKWIVPYIWIAGGLQLLVASSNVFAAKMFRYRESLRTLPVHLAEVFVVLGRSVSGFLSVFWCGRLIFQLFFYDWELRRQHRAFDVLFLFAFAYLVVVFTIGALRANL